MDAPDFDLDLDDDLQAYLEFSCPDCSRPHRLALEGLQPGSTHTCTCGYAFGFEGDDLAQIQASLDDLHHSLGNFGS